MNPAMDLSMKKLNELRTSLKSRTDVPSDVISTINEVADLIDKREAYIERMTTEGTEALQQNRKNAFENSWTKLYEERKTRRNFTPRMISGEVEVQFIKSIIAGSKAKRILELGLFTGYGAMAMAEALPPDGVVVSCEIDPYLIKNARAHFEGTPYAKRIQILEGPALESLEKLAEEGQQFDVVFIDADKENYPNYYTILMDKSILARGGVMLFDNAFWLGTVYSEEGTKSDSTKAVIKTNEMIRNDERVHQVMLPIKDGLYMVRRKEDFTIY